MMGVSKKTVARREPSALSTDHMMAHITRKQYDILLILQAGRRAGMNKYEVSEEMLNLEAFLQEEGLGLDYKGTTPESMSNSLATIWRRGLVNISEYTEEGRHPRRWFLTEKGRRVLRMLS